MKIYKDKELIEEVEILDFGIVPAGEIEKFKFWVLNDSPAYLKELMFTIGHNEVEVIEYPKQLRSNSVGELLIEWTPSITLKEGLRAKLQVVGKEVWG